ncbi:uncharacterized protein LOC133339998, partial [Lethenteron reissneri]|uniref:uncharacterized protein LOC133339998 n=1 Tax=Lethenteron reissneri TaxID=7753 RepID=UPI002AB76C7D
SEVTDAWYSEIGRHNFDILSPQPESARFCQLVWRASQRLGVGRAVSPQGCVVVVALYDPPALGQRCATPGNDADMIAVSPVAAPNGSCVPGTEAVDEDCGPRVAESADDDDCVLAVDAGVMLTVDDASGVGKSEKSSLVEGVPESEAMEDPERSVAESTATVMGESAGTRAVGTRGKTDASSEMAPKEAMPKSVSFLSLGDAPWTMELLSMQSADTDLDTEESSGTETLVMDSDRTTCEIMERSEAEAIEELPWVVERGHGGAGSCEGVGREDTLVMEKILDESRPKEHTGGGDEAEMVAGKDIRTSEEDQEEFCMDVLAEHNRLREIHGARPLRRSVALGRDARAWARVLARSRALRSHPTVPHGQNVWARHIGTGELPKGGDGEGAV